MMVAGVDASSTACGWGVVDGDKYFASGTIKARAGEFSADRLNNIALRVTQALATKGELRGAVIGVEMPSGFTSGRGKAGIRARASVAKGDITKCAMAAGAIGARLAGKGAKVVFLKPNEWKGSWSKQAVCAWTQRVWPSTTFSATSKAGQWGQDAMEAAAIAYFMSKGKL